MEPVESEDPMRPSHLVTPKALPKAAIFFEEAFGIPPDRILFFPGSTGNGWDSAPAREHPHLDALLGEHAARLGGSPGDEAWSDL